MLTKEKQAAWGLCLAGWMLLALLTGCRPTGPDALLNGKQFLEAGQPVAAARRLREATALMPTNALAWGYLGLAYHQAGSVSNAVQAYSRALALSPDLAEVRWSLGCLWMEQGRWLQAREQLAAATVLQPRQAASWQRLGEAQLRLGQTEDAIRDLQEALRLDARNPDAWNWLGVAQLQQGRAQEAANSFQAALRLRTNHGPALLNLAIVHQTALHQPQKALELYGQYLAFLPTASNAPQVGQVMTQLQNELNPAVRPGQVARLTEAEAQRPSSAEPGGDLENRTQPSPLLSRVLVRTNPPSRPEPASTLTPAPERPATKRKADSEPVPEVVYVKPAPAITPAAHPPPPPSGSGSSTTLSGNAASEVTSATRDSGKPRRGFFAKINPLNLFRKRSDEKTPTPLPSGSDLSQENPAPAPSTRSVPARVEVANADFFQRYVYAYSSPPAVGDARAATRACQQADKWMKRARQTEAVQAYRSAVEADPSHFTAQFNLGLLSLEGGETATALRAFEAATRIDPDSTAARYNLALALKSGGYPIDSANELLTLLAQDPGNVRAHLTLGNLYSQQFGDAVRAREQYLRVLELDPGHPQAGSIRFWLVQNPL